MNIPLRKIHRMLMYDTDPLQFQLTKDGVPVTDDLSTQEIVFFIRNHDSSWQNIQKDIVAEGWVVDNVNKIIKVIIDTQDYLMCEGNEEVRYNMRIEWVDKKLILADYEVLVSYVELWSNEC